MYVISIEIVGQAETPTGLYWPIQHGQAVYCTHRRRIELEDKAKVVASDWGTKSLPLQLFCLGFLKQTVEFNRPPCHASCFALVFLKQIVEFNHLIQKDGGKAASTARILSPNPTRRPLPCLLIKSFFYAALSPTPRCTLSGY